MARPLSPDAAGGPDARPQAGLAPAALAPDAATLAVLTPDAATLAAASPAVSATDAASPAASIQVVSSSAVSAPDAASPVVSPSAAQAPDHAAPQPGFSLDDYTFPLPEELIAQAPAEKRDASRLLVVAKGAGVAAQAVFAELADHLPAGALLVANNTKVLPARLLTTKPSGGALEFLLLTPLPLIEPHETGTWNAAKAQGLMRASKKPKPGQRFDFAPDLAVEIVSRGEFGHCQVVLHWQGELAQVFERIGHMPLPPYIRRPDSQADRARYQTLHADPARQGSVAAPTAGLHFTPAMRSSLAEKGFGWAEVTLHVGYGTFSPVRSQDIRRHAMHAEFAEMSPQTAQAVREAKAQGRPVVAVGTTSARALEGAFAQTGTIAPFRGWTDIFITPGHRFAVVDAMLTNFHLPGSSLVVMVSALAGLETIRQAYALAVKERYRFFSYGDAMLIR